jgi:hypothetical protein
VKLIVGRFAGFLIPSAETSVKLMLACGRYLIFLSSSTHITSGEICQTV